MKARYCGPVKHKHICTGCLEYFDEVVVVGEEDWWDSATAHLCRACVLEALEVLDKKEGAE